MQRAAIRLRIDGNCRDPHAPGRPDDAASDLAAIGDQDFFEHV
jgi:hypothetical protein